VANGAVNRPRRANIQPTTRYIYIQRGEYKPPEPPIFLFCVNELPIQANAQYLWLDSAIWDDNNFWIDG